LVVFVHEVELLVVRATVDLMRDCNPLPKRRKQNLSRGKITLRSFCRGLRQHRTEPGQNAYSQNSEKAKGASLAGWEEWLICGVIIAVTTAGKFGGTLLAARITGLGWRESSALGVLMNTRGLIELIVLNIGLELKVISPQLFAMMVLMALVTTIATTPRPDWDESIRAGLNQDHGARGLRTVIIIKRCAPLEACPSHTGSATCE
jgi:hypothetical protein